MKKSAEDMILRGRDAWNMWRAEHPNDAYFSHPNWYDSPGPHGIQVKGTNRLDFSGMDLSGARISNAFAEGLNLRGATFVGTFFDEGDFSRADFSNAHFRDCHFNKTTLTGGIFKGASMVNCNLNRVNLVGADFRVREIRETVVYGVAAWDLTIDGESKQSRLVIENTYELYSDLVEQEYIPIMVDNIEIAQFVHFLTNYKRIRDAIEVLNDRGVLLLGRFKDGGLDRLDRIRQHLQLQGYLAMIFDFERPDAQNLIETVVTMAGLSKFVIADLSGPRVPGELRAIEEAYALPILTFGDGEVIPSRSKVVRLRETDDVDLLARIDEALPQLERFHQQRIVEISQGLGEG